MRKNEEIELKKGKNYFLNKDYHKICFNGINEDLLQFEFYRPRSGGCKLAFPLEKAKTDKIVIMGRKFKVKEYYSDHIIMQYLGK